jgi:hypothetical protein
MPESFRTLTVTGGEVIVDAEDYDDLIQFDWCISRGYAVRKVKLHKNTWANEYMHRRILRKDLMLSEYTEVDHINGNRLCNVKSNLRLCSKAQNNRNAKRKPGQSGFRGVTHYHDKRYNSKHRWRVMIHVDYKCISFGYFDDAETAAKVYDEAAIKYHGEFATLNFPKALWQDTR